MTTGAGPATAGFSSLRAASSSGLPGFAASCCCCAANPAGAAGGAARATTGRSNTRPRRRLFAGTCRSTHTSLGRRDSRNRRHGRAGNHCGCHAHSGAGYGLRLHECSRRNRDNGTRHLPVGIDDVGHVRVVVIVVDDGGVDHCVAAVDVLEIAAAYRVRRPIDIARPEREPRDAADVTAGDRYLEIAAADERDERRRVVSARRRGPGTQPQVPFRFAQRP